MFPKSSDRPGSRLLGATLLVTEIERSGRILVLRAFNQQDGIGPYDLVEIPKSLLLRMGDLTADYFSERNKYGSSGADVKDEDVPGLLQTITPTAHPAGSPRHGATAASA